jgi:hypothetical protein
VYNLELWFFIGGGGSPETAPRGSGNDNPLLQLVGGVVGMFIIVTVIGEVIVWLKREISKAAGEMKRVI